MTVEHALTQLTESTADAVVGVLAQCSGGPVERGAVSVVPPTADPFAGIPAPSVACNVSYVDGVTGGNVFVVSVRGARKLAAAMMGAEAADGEHDLDELELSAVAEAANQMMAAAAAATGGVLGQEVHISPPETRLLAAGRVETAFDRTPHATSVSLTVLGEPCRLVQLVPNGFVVRMTRALDGLTGDAAVVSGEPGFSADALRAVRVRVAAELGRATLVLGDLVGLPQGAVVELDAGAEDPVDLFVNGRRFASGRLLLTDGQWAVRLESILEPEELASTVKGGRT